MLLAFTPFIVFALVDRASGATSGLIAGMAVSAAMLARDWVSPGRTPKVLEIGTVILFGILALYAVLGGSSQSVFGVRLAMDAGLMLIVLISIAIRRPFTLQYAREQVAQEHWGSATFIRVNYVITAAWALAFAVMVLADMVLVYEPDVPPTVGVVVTILALIAAIKFTGWYPERQRAKTGSLPKVGSV